MAEICKFQHIGPYPVTQSGTNGCEVRYGDGNVVCWTQDRATALIICGLLDAYFEQSQKLKNAGCS